MNTHIRHIVVSIAFALLASRAVAQHPQMPPGMTHEEHLAQMQKDAELKKRGTAAMGFDQDAVSHHFRLSASGGSIEVAVKDPRDAASLAAIRAHLKEIAGEFAAGRFDAPFATHAEVPPGVAAMQERKSAIAYRYEEMTEGARVVIATTDAAALAAIHDFLRYQIREHKTGDPVTINRSAR